MIAEGRPTENFGQLSPEMRQVAGDALSTLPQDLRDKLVITSTTRPPIGRDVNHTGDALDIRNRNLTPQEEARVAAAFIQAGAIGVGVYGPPGTGTHPSFQSGPHIHIDLTGRYGRVQAGARQDNPYVTRVLQQHAAGQSVSLQRAGLASYPKPVPRPDLNAENTPRLSESYRNRVDAKAFSSPSTFPQRPSRASVLHDAPSIRSPDQFQYQAANARRAAAPPAPAPSRSVNLRSMFSSMQGADYVMPGRAPAPSRSPSRDVMVDQYRQRALEMRGRSATSQGAMRPTATDFERVRRASVPTAPRREVTRPADRVSEVFERFSRPSATQAPLGPNGPGVTTEVLGDPLGVTGGSFFSSPLMGPSVGPFRPARAAPASSRLVRPSVAPVRTRPTKTRATQTRTTPAPWERQSGVDGSVAYGGKQPSTPNARSRSSSGQSLGGSILDSIFGNPTNPWERQHGSRVYGGRDQPTSPNARSKSSRGSKSGGSGGGGGGCFITTAICQAANLPDDCHELTTLRRFRDEVMRPDPTMKADIEHYYEVAPRIVAGVEATGRADAIWADTRAHYLEPAIAHIEAGDHDLAHAVYRRMVKDLSVFGEGA